MRKLHSYAYIGELFKKIQIALHPDVAMHKNDVENLRIAIKKLTILIKEWNMPEIKGELAVYVADAIASIDYAQYRKEWEGKTPVECLIKVQTILEDFVSKVGKMTADDTFTLRATSAFAQAMWVEWRFLKMQYDDVSNKKRT